MYATAHVHDVDCHDQAEDGETPVDIDADFEVAPGDASDVQVANLYGWGCVGLVFGDGLVSDTALDVVGHPPHNGVACSHCSIQFLQ